MQKEIQRQFSQFLKTFNDGIYIDSLREMILGKSASAFSILTAQALIEKRSHYGKARKHTTWAIASVPSIAVGKTCLLDLMLTSSSHLQSVFLQSLSEGACNAKCCLTPKLCRTEDKQSLEVSSEDIAGALPLIWFWIVEHPRILLDLLHKAANQLAKEQYPELFEDAEEKSHDIYVRFGQLSMQENLRDIRCTAIQALPVLLVAASKFCWRACF